MVLFSCKFSDSKEKNTPNDNKQPEIIPNNYTVYDMPPNLKEISGITFINDSLVAAVEDENAVVYFYSLKDKKIVREMLFGKKDDYEDLVKVGNALYVIISNGTIVKIDDFENNTPKISTINTPLKSKNNIEGIGYSPKTNSLLLVVKDMGLDAKNENKEIYSYNLKTNYFDPKPFYTIEHTVIESYFKGDAIEEASKKLLKSIGNKNLNEIIRPSALAINPLNNELYILSSINNVIIVLAEDKSFKRIINFKGSHFSQPEGIAFDNKGQLYISNEGKKGAGNIIKVENVK